MTERLEPAGNDCVPRIPRGTSSIGVPSVYLTSLGWSGLFPGTYQRSVLSRFDNSDYYVRSYNPLATLRSGCSKHGDAPVVYLRLQQFGLEHCVASMKSEAGASPTTIYPVMSIAVALFPVG